MSKGTKKTDVTDDIFMAWALYTGPAGVTPLWTNSRWIAGEWTGINRDTTESGIIEDIIGRIKYVIGAFKFARFYLTSKKRLGGRVFFSIPEFFFHCRQGPYPYVNIGGKYPFEYICSILMKELGSIELLDGETWVVCTGSVLTCSEPDIDSLLASERVKERLDALNSAMKDLANEKGYRTAQDFRKGGPHIKAFSYTDAARPTTDSEKAIDDLMTEYRANPLCVARNRGAIITLGKGAAPSLYCYEKQNEATVDLTMGKMTSEGKLELGGMVTEWMAGYPSISIINGDKNTAAAPLASRISVLNESGNDSALELGVEVCLDHRVKRTRRTVGMTKKNGAAEDNPPLDVQLIPSGGMQVLDSCVSAGVDGAMFNCDGCDPILTKYDGSGKPVIEGSGVFKKITCGVYASSAQKLKELDGHKYYCHSQLAFRFGKDAMTGYDNALGTENVNGPTYDGDQEDPKNPTLDAYSNAEVIPLELSDTNSLFAADSGELHCYSRPKSG